MILEPRGRHEDDEPQAIHLPARDMAIPRSVSADAQAILAMAPQHPCRSRRSTIRTRGGAMIEEADKAVETMLAAREAPGVTLAFPA
jgi:hypothetical protein